MPSQPESTTGITANGVPYIALPPPNGQQATAVLVLWHGADAPSSEEALAASLPLHDLPAWRFYLGLPLTGQRLPPGGIDEMGKREVEDAIALEFHPIVTGAVQEFPAALDDLYSRFGIRQGVPLGLFGFSMGGAAALLASLTPIATAPLQAVFTFGAVVKFRSLVDYIAQMFETTYDWTEERVRLSREISVDHRAAELAQSRVKYQFAIGGADPLPIEGSTRRLAEAVREQGGSAEVDVVPNIGHAFAPNPDDPEGATLEDAREVNERLSKWFESQF